MNNRFRRIFQVIARGGGAAAISYLEHDQYTTDRAAGAVNGTAMEPGPGTRVLVDTGNHVSLSGGEKLSDGVVTGFTDPLQYGAAQARVAGLAFGLTHRQTAAHNGMRGWRSAQAGAVSVFRVAAYFASGGLNLYNGGSSLATNFSYANATNYQVVCIAHGTGGSLYAKGGALTTWNCMYVDRVGTLTPLYGGDTQGSAGAEASDNWREVLLPAPFTTDYGPADVYEATVTNGLTYTMPSTDCYIFLVVSTLPDAGAEVVLKFNIQDASNYWALVVNNRSGATCDLVIREVVAGTPTNHATATGVVTAGERVGVLRLATGNSVSSYDSTQQRNIKSSATNFKTQTAGEVLLGAGAACANLESHARVARAAIQTVLDTFFP